MADILSAARTRHQAAGTRHPDGNTMAGIIEAPRATTSREALNL